MSSRPAVQMIELMFPSLIRLSRSDYGLETLPIAICSYVFLVSHPARYIPSDRSVRLHPERDALPTPTSDEEKNLDGDGIGKSRRWYLAGMKR